jgi:hypothetical protein
MFFKWFAELKLIRGFKVFSLKDDGVLKHVECCKYNEISPEKESKYCRNGFYRFDTVKNSRFCQSFLVPRGNGIKLRIGCAIGDFVAYILPQRHREAEVNSIF